VTNIQPTDQQPLVLVYQNEYDVRAVRSFKNAADVPADESIPPEPEKLYDDAACLSWLEDGVIISVPFHRVIQIRQLASALFD